jgi:hypothetical protein
MARESVYDGQMKRRNRASAAALGVLVAAVVLVPSAGAQINGAPPSVTSLGFGGQNGSIHGTAPSVTSLGPRGYTPGRSSFPSGATIFGPSRGNINGHHHPHGQGYYPWGGYYAVPYYDDESAYADAPTDDEYNGGPTIFDRRGPGTPAPRPPDVAGSNYASDRQSDAPAPEPTPASDPPQTVLIFKDGHQLEVANYAIVGDSLFDLTEGRRHKIALSDLNLTATSKQNEDRGIDFQLPSGTQAN